MTREEAIRCLDVYSSTNGSGLCTDKQHYEAKQMAIKALEHEPCEDAISRQAAIDGLNSINGTSELDKAFEVIENLPPVNPQPKIGHWIDKTRQSACGIVFCKVECSECGESSGLSHTLAKYCPNCGAKMVESQESEE